MRILHTSDWHLGRTLHGVDLMTHQAAFLDHLVDVVRAGGVDAVLVAGDIYDRAVPPVEAVALLSDAIARLAEHADVVLTPGNHDSAIRLGFGAQLMRPGVHLRTRIADADRPVEIHRPGGSATLLVYALPYLDPDAARTALASPPAPPLARSHEAVMAAAMRRAARDLASRRAAGGAGGAVRAVAMAHAFVVGGAASESERDIRVGGVDGVPAEVLAGPGFDYVALGHLHGPQVVRLPPGPGGPALARYAGSPLAYSFSELHQTKSTVLVDLDTGGVELVPAPVPRRLAEVTGGLAEVLGAAGEPHVADWVRVVVTDAVRPPDLYARVKARFPHALQVTHRPPARAGRTVVAAGPARDPLEVAGEFVEYVTGTAPSDAESAILRAALETATAADRSA